MLAQKGFHHRYFPLIFSKRLKTAILQNATLYSQFFHKECIHKYDGLEMSLDTPKKYNNKTTNTDNYHQCFFFSATIFLFYLLFCYFFYYYYFYHYYYNLFLNTNVIQTSSIKNLFVSKNKLIYQYYSFHVQASLNKVVYVNH